MARARTTDVELTAQQDRVHVHLTDGRVVTIYNSGRVTTKYPFSTTPAIVDPRYKYHATSMGPAE